MGGNSSAAKDNSFLCALADPDALLPCTAWGPGLESLRALDLMSADAAKALSVKDSDLASMLDTLLIHNTRTGKMRELLRQAEQLLNTTICNRQLHGTPHVADVVTLAGACIRRVMDAAAGHEDILATHLVDGERCLVRPLAAAAVRFLLEVPRIGATVRAHAACTKVLLVLLSSIGEECLGGDGSDDEAGGNTAQTDDAQRHPYVGVVLDVIDVNFTYHVLHMYKAYVGTAVVRSSVARKATSSYRLAWLLPWRFFWRPKDTPEEHQQSDMLTFDDIAVRGSMWVLLSLAYRGKCGVTTNGVLRELTALSGGLGDLVDALTSMPHTCEEGWLLMYLLLNDNPHFMAYVLTKSCQSRVVVSLLKALYHAVEIQTDTVYVLLTILMVVSQDSTWNVALFDAANAVPAVPWYRERILAHVSPGSLLIIVIVRCIQHNMLSAKDTFITRSCLAVLANTAPSYSELHSHASQRLVFLISNMSKRVARINGRLVQAQGDDYSLRAELEDSVAFLKNVLECVHACMVSRLSANPSLIYELLQQRHALAPIADVAKLIPLVAAITQVLTHFELEIDKADHVVSSAVSANEIMGIIVEAAAALSTADVHEGVYNDLKFRYDEEPSAAREFFLPMVWRLVVVGAPGVVRHELRDSILLESSLSSIVAK
eukprot:PhM_4_TR11433/c0_g2_i1/m.23346